MPLAAPDWNNLRNREHFNLHREFRELAEETGIGTLGLNDLFPEYLQVYEQEEKAQGQLRGSALSESIAQADAAREETFRGLRLVLKGLSHHYREDIRRAAKRLGIFLGVQNRLRHLGYDRKTATLTALLRDLQKDSAGDTKLLNLTGWVQELQQRNETFQARKAQRHTERASRPAIPLKEVRHTADLLFARIRERIQAEMLIQGGAVLQEFSRKWNVRVESYQRELARRRGRSVRRRKEARD